MMKENMTSSSSLSSKTFYVENLGCSKNQVDAGNNHLGSERGGMAVL